MSRILHVLSQIPAKTGSGVFLENLVRQCAGAGHDQGLVVGLPKAFSGYCNPYICPENMFEVLFETADLPFLIPGMSDVMPYESTVFSTLNREQTERYHGAFYHAAKRALEAFKPDVILINHLWLAAAAVKDAVMDYPGVKPGLYAISHGTDLRQLQLCPELGTLAVTGCRQLDGVFALSARQAKQIGQQYGIDGERIHVVGTGYDHIIFFSPMNHADRETPKIELVYAGKLARSKGLPELLAAMEQLDGSRYRLTIAGNGGGAEGAALLDRIAASKADIRYLGQLTQNQLADLFRASDIFVLPSYYEGLPLVVLEALACGLRVVVNELGGLREWPGEALVASGRIRFVPMPPLSGPDACLPAAIPAYVNQLASAIDTSASRRDEPTDSSCEAIKEKTWSKVFQRMEAVFQR